jgi:hypothetical protein
VAIESALEPRQLTADDEPWVQRFAVGIEWWSHEITDYLREQALEDTLQGINTTTLFSFPGLKDVVGYITLASSSLPTAKVGAVINLPERMPSSVPSILIAYLGVANAYRRVGHFGQEIHLQVLEGMAHGWAGTRLMYAECWEENVGGLAFWEKVGYTRFQKFAWPRSDTGERAPIWRFIYDRFALQPK